MLKFTYLEVYYKNDWLCFPQLNFKDSGITKTDEDAHEQGLVYMKMNVSQTTCLAHSFSHLLKKIHKRTISAPKALMSRVWNTFIAPERYDFVEVRHLGTTRENSANNFSRHKLLSENSVVVGLPVSCLLQVLLDVNCPRRLEDFVRGTLLS